jgi:hypothetical protein
MKVSATENLQNSDQMGGHISTSQAQKLGLVHVSCVAKIVTYYGLHGPGFKPQGDFLNPFTAAMRFTQPKDS